MHPSAERVQRALAELGSGVAVVELPVRAATAREAAAAVGAEVGEIAKTLVFLAGDEPVLVIASGAHRVDVDKLSALLGAPVRRADPDAVRTHTGFAIGGVPPLGHAAPLRTLMDGDLMAYPRIWAAAGTPNALFALSPQELVHLTGGQVVDIAERP